MNNEKEQINSGKQINSEEQKKIKIIFQKQEDGSYGFKNVEISGNQTNEEECKIIKINENKFQDICNGKDINFRLFSSAEKQNIVLELDEETSKDAIEFAKNRNTEIEDLKQLLEERFKNIEKAELKEFNGLAGFCVEFKKEEVKEENKTPVVDISKIKPLEIIEKIKQNVVGQDSAVKDIVKTICFNQFIFDEGDEDSIEAQKANILVDGPTGTGKTFIAKQIAHTLNLPIFIAKASEYSAPGYTGKSLESMLVQLLKEAKGNLELAERGIIVLDEFDKLGTGKLDMRDAIQDELLTYIGGQVIEIEYAGKKYDFDTSKITFICAGAFTDLRKEKQKEGIDENGYFTIKTDDYVKLGGIKKELIGRLTFVTSTDPLGEEGLRKILLESKSSPMLQQCRHYDKKFNVKVIYSDEIIDKIIKEAINIGTNGRALKNMFQQINSIISDEVLEKNPTEIVITDEIVQRAKNAGKRKADNFEELQREKLKN